jgi:GT2 family glycosyltransferase
VVGFGLLNKDNEPMEWNYGDLMHPVREAKEEAIQFLYQDRVISKDQFIKYAPGRAASLRLIKENDVKKVGWIAEGCMAVRTDVLQEVDGFASEMRYHETHDLCVRIKESGRRIVFCPETIAHHLEFDTRMQRRDEDSTASRIYYYHRNWGMSESVLKRLYDEDQ